MPNYTDIGSVPGAWRSGTIASTASAALSRFGSYNPGTNHVISTGQVVRTTNPADYAAIQARSESLGSRLAAYDNGRSSFDSGPRTNAMERNQLVGEAARLRTEVATYNADATIFNTSHG